MAGFDELKAQFNNIGKIIKPSDLLIIMGEVYGNQGKVETKKLFWELQTKITQLPENKR